MSKSMLAMCVMLVLTVTACGEVESIDEGAPAETQPGQTATQATTDEGTEPAEEEAQSEVAIEEETSGSGIRTIEFDQPFVHEGPATMSVLAIRFMSREHAEGEDPDVGAFLDEGTQSIVSLKVEATNGGDEPFDWYPNQDALVIGDEQVDAAVFISDEVSGDNWQPGVKKDGTIHWESRQSFEQLTQLASARYLLDAPFSTETFEPVGEDFEIEITWQP